MAAISCRHTQCQNFTHLAFLAEALYVFGAFLVLPWVAAVHLDTNLLDDIGIRERGDVAGVHAVLDGSEHTAHDFAGAGFRHVRHDVDIFWPCDFANYGFDGDGDFLLDVFGRLEPRLQRNVNDRDAALHFVHCRNDGGFRNFRNREAKRLDFLGAEAVPGDIDDIIHAAEDAIVAVRGKHGAIRSVIRPIAPILAFRVPAILSVILTGETVGVSPNGLHDARPGIADADVSGHVRAGFDFLRFFVPNHRINSQRRRACAAGLHRIERGLGGAEESSRFGLPPSVHDDGFAFADDVVIPLPDFRLDGLADRGHVLEMVVIFFRFFCAGFAQHANRGRRSVENIDIEALCDAPRTADVGELRHAFVKDAGGRESKGAINNVGMAGDPADVRHAPVDVFWMNVLVILRGAGHVSEIAARAMLAAFGLARGAAGVHQEERRFGVLGNGLDGFAAIVFENAVNEIVAI